MRASLVLVVAAACGGAAPPPPPPPAAPPPKLVPALPSESTGMPDGYVAMHAARVVPTGDGMGAVLLADDAEEIVLPIFIGGTEAASIDARLDGRPRVRPLTHDLFDATLAELHAKLVKVQVDELRDGVYIGTIFVRAGTRVFKVDARPSDAIALAIGNHVPIYVARAVLDVAGVHRDDVQKRLGTGGPPTISS